MHANFQFIDPKTKVEEPFAKYMVSKVTVLIRHFIRKRKWKQVLNIDILCVVLCYLL
jgi:hypothetical protein